MKKQVKVFLLIFNFCCLIIACIWFNTTEDKFEPLIVALQLFITLIVLLFGDNVVRRIEVLKIDGSKVEINKEANARVSDVRNKSEVKIK